MMSDVLAPPLTIISPSMPADGALLGDVALDLGAAAVLDPVFVADVARDEVGLLADHRVDAVGRLLGEAQDVRLELLEVGP